MNHAAWCGGFLLAATLLSSPPPRSLPVVTIVGTDYAFQIPARIRPGPTLIAFENRGTVHHEMAIALLRPGVSVDSALQGLARGTRRRDVIEGQAALIVAAPGEAPGPRLWLDLHRGRTYLVSCILRDAPDKPPHVTLGMMGSFSPN